MVNNLHPTLCAGFQYKLSLALIFQFLFYIFNINVFVDVIVYLV